MFRWKIGQNHFLPYFDNLYSWVYYTKKLKLQWLFLHWIPEVIKFRIMIVYSKSQHSNPFFSEQTFLQKNQCNFNSFHSFHFKFSHNIVKYNSFKVKSYSWYCIQWKPEIHDIIFSPNKHIDEHSYELD